MCAGVAADTARHGPISLGSPFTLLAAGFDPDREPYLAQELRKCERRELKGLREGKVAMRETYNLMGIADPTGSLPEGHVCIVREGVVLGQSGGSESEADKVVIYRSPGCLEGDMRKATNTVTAELHKVLAGAARPRCNAIFFSILGNCSMADEMGGGDLDGDMFMVLADPEIVSNFSPRPRWILPPVSEPNAQPPTSLLKLFMQLRHSTCSLVGDCATRLLALADSAGLDNPEVQRLGCGYYRALDGELLHEPKVNPFDWPAFMRERTKRTNVRWAQTPSTSTLSLMYHADLSSGRIRSNGGSTSAATSTSTSDSAQSAGAPPKLARDGDLFVDRYLSGEPIEIFHEFVRKWTPLAATCRSELRTLLEGACTDAEVELSDEIAGKVTALYEKYRCKLLESYEVDAVFGDLSENMNLLIEVSALYKVAYDAASQKWDVSKQVAGWRDG